MSTLYAVCTTPRSGSNLLCDLLEGSREMGCPREFFNLQSFVVPFAEHHGLIEDSRVPFDRYLDQVVDVFSTSNGVFGTKLLFDQFEPYMALASVRSFLKSCKFIWLIRKDVVAQAVSMYIANAT